MKGYSNDLYILAFDHRGTLTKGLLGVEGRPPTDEEAARVSSMKDIIFDGFLEAQNKGINGGDPAILVDETFGLQVQQKAKEMGIKFAAPVEKSGQKIFDFEYGDNFGEKIKEVDADFVKILVRWNPSDDSETREVQGERIKTLSKWLDENERKFLLEFLVPATDEQLESVDGDQSRYDSEIRPKLAVQVVEEMRERGADPDIWKIEGLDTVEDNENVSKVIKDGGREDVIAVVLGRGANDEKVNEWLRAGSSVDGYKGFAIGRSIFWNSLKGWHSGAKSREEAGGVGSVAVHLLAQAGYEVAASTGRPETSEYLTQLGAKQIVSRQELAELPSGPLSSERWGGCIDAVGDTTLAHVLTEMEYGSSVAACGLAGGNALDTTVIPFLLRGVNLLGIDSVMCPFEKRVQAWGRLDELLNRDVLSAMTTTVGLADVPHLGSEILAGKVQGRTVIDLNK